MVDIVSFAEDRVDAQLLRSEYKALLFSGWNTSSEKQYRELLEYVREGRTLFAAIPHFSTNISRNYASYGADELVRHGDLSELCGVIVKEKGRRFYWAIAPDRSGELGFEFPRRFGIAATCLGKIEIVDPTVEVLVVEDEAMEPLLLRRKFGKGTVYFLNSWAYPGAMDEDDGPGATVDSTGLIGHIYAHIAMQNRGAVWMTGDGACPSADSAYISYSYFPEDGRICLQNIDFKQCRSGKLHHFGVCEQIDLAPGEFRILQSRPSVIR